MLMFTLGPWHRENFYIYILSLYALNNNHTFMANNNNNNHTFMANNNNNNHTFMANNNNNNHIFMAKS